METLLHAQPYDTSANGFYFRSSEEYEEKVNKAFNAFGHRVEEFEIQFIDGENIDCELAGAIGLNQANFQRYFELIDEMDEWEKIRAVIAFNECGYCFDTDEDIELDDVDLYEVESLRELAEHFVDEGLMGEIPENLLSYFNYDALARDLACDYSETTVAGKRLVYRCY